MLRCRLGFDNRALTLHSTRVVDVKAFGFASLVSIVN